MAQLFSLGMKLADIIYVSVVLVVTFVTPVWMAAFMASRWFDSATKMKNWRSIRILGNVRFIAAVAFSIPAMFVLQKPADLDLFSGWALAHGSFIFIWPVMFGLILGLYYPIRAKK